ncbi:hypothetical protein [Sulfurovum sp.]|uniref:hypothetical protein n=1 Tax=Sulfurovum sp. TaxID=1969726 RepID=UPI0035655656
MITCDKEISLLVEKMEKDIPICSLHSIQELIECAKNIDLDTRYFPVVDCGFIVYKDTIIFLTSEDGVTILSLNPITL